jgi:hypothetical protein
MSRQGGFVDPAFGDPQTARIGEVLGEGVLEASRLLESLGDHGPADLRQALDLSFAELDSTFDDEHLFLP